MFWVESDGTVTDWCDGVGVGVQLVPCDAGAGGSVTAEVQEVMDLVSEPVAVVKGKGVCVSESGGSGGVPCDAMAPVIFAPDSVEFSYPDPPSESTVQKGQGRGGVGVRPSLGRAAKPAPGAMAEGVMGVRMSQLGSKKRAPAEAVAGPAKKEKVEEVVEGAGFSAVSVEVKVAAKCDVCVPSGVQAGASVESVMTEVPNMADVLVPGFQSVMRVGVEELVKEVIVGPFKEAMVEIGEACDVVTVKMLEDMKEEVRAVKAERVVRQAALDAARAEKARLLSGVVVHGKCWSAKSMEGVKEYVKSMVASGSYDVAKMVETVRTLLQ